MNDVNKNNLLYVPKIEPEQKYKSDAVFPLEYEPPQISTPEEPKKDTPKEIYNDFSEIIELIKITGVPELEFINETIERLKKRLEVAFPDGKLPEEGTKQPPGGESKPPKPTTTTTKPPDIPYRPPKPNTGIPNTGTGSNDNPDGSPGGGDPKSGDPGGGVPKPYTPVSKPDQGDNGPDDQPGTWTPPEGGNGGGGPGTPTKPEGKRKKNKPGTWLGPKNEPGNGEPGTWITDDDDDPGNEPGVGPDDTPPGGDNPWNRGGPTISTPRGGIARPVITRVTGGGSGGTQTWHVDRNWDIDPNTNLPVDNGPGTEETPDDVSFHKDTVTPIEEIDEEEEHHIHELEEEIIEEEEQTIEVPDMFPNDTNVVLNVVPPKTIVEIIKGNYERDTVNLHDFYLQKLQLILQRYFQRMMTIMIECDVGDIDNLTMDFDGEYVVVTDPNMRHLRDSVCRSQIMRKQKERYIKKLFNVDATMLHMNRWHVAEKEREFYYSESYGDSGTYLDSHSNTLLRDCRSQYDSAYNQSVYDMYKYLNSSCEVLDDVLEMVVREAWAKGQMLKNGVDIYKNREAEEEKEAEKRRAEELEKLRKQKEENENAKPMSMSGGGPVQQTISLEESNKNSGTKNTPGSTTPSSTTPSSSSASSAAVEKAVQTAISIANSGVSYGWGGNGPDVFDCTGFVSYSFQQAGWPISPCHGSAFDDAFASMGFERMEFSGGDCSSLQRGDVLCNSHHAGLYIGGAELAEAVNEEYGVCIHPFRDYYSWEYLWRYKG